MEMGRRAGRERRHGYLSILAGLKIVFFVGGLFVSHIQQTA